MLCGKGEGPEATVIMMEIHWEKGDGDEKVDWALRAEQESEESKTLRLHKGKIRENTSGKSPLRIIYLEEWGQTPK